jgi:glycosyltransferase involved in cell wall biosynthesis
VFSRKDHVTAIVVTFNEERRLRECLNGLSVLDQLIVIDLGSSDKSIEIAKSFNAEVYDHCRVPFVEQLLPLAQSMSKSDWILRADPDEVYPNELIEEVYRVIETDESIGELRLPIQYYYKGRPLNTTIWGGIRYIPKVVHRQRVDFRPLVHHGIKCLQGFRTGHVDYDGNTKKVIRHYWADSFADLFEKHWRYVKCEGQARYHSGQRFSWFSVILKFMRALRLNLIDCNGFRGGFEGISLSFFYSCYVLMSLISLRLYERTKDE